jgi:hypothetical protein
MMRSRHPPREPRAAVSSSTCAEANPMNTAVSKILRCAVYTRKSTEHNLDLAFASLDAQREACEAYILSQASEGWRLLGATATMMAASPERRFAPLQLLPGKHGHEPLIRGRT